MDKKITFKQLDVVDATEKQLDKFKGKAIPLENKKLVFFPELKIFKLFGQNRSKYYNEDLLFIDEFVGVIAEEECKGGLVVTCKSRLAST